MEMKQEFALIGARLKLVRTRARVTQSEAASAAGVTRATVSNWEAGRNMPCLLQFRSLMATYGESPYRVLFGRSMFGFTRADVEELNGAIRNCSPGLRRKIELLMAVQVRGDMDEDQEAATPPRQPLA